MIRIMHVPTGNNFVTEQARSQDLERGGSFSVSADRRISVCDPNYLSGGTVSPSTGSGAEPRRQTHFDNNLLKIVLKSGL